MKIHSLLCLLLAAILCLAPVMAPAEESETTGETGTSLTLTSQDAREIVMPEDALGDAWKDAHFFILTGDTAEFTVTFAGDDDPAVALAVDHTAREYLLADCLTDGGYVFSVAMTDGRGTVTLYPDGKEGERKFTTAFFAGEKEADSFLAEQGENAGISWKYLEDTDKTPDPGLLPREASYTLIFTDQNGDPVPGLIANVCDDSTCTPMTTDAEGKIVFTKAPFAYHIQVLKVPEGYTYDRSIETYLELLGGETTFTVTKD